MKLEEYVKHYDDHYVAEGESGSGQLVWEPQYRIWLKAGYEPSMSVLDYGCGVGIMTEAGLAPNHYWGFDISIEAIKLAKKKYPEYYFATFKMGKLSQHNPNIAVAQSVFTHTPKAYVDECLGDIKRNFKEFAIIDVLHGYDDPMDYHVRRFTADGWHDTLWRNKLKGEYLGEHDFVGYNHVYYKVTHER